MYLEKIRRFIRKGEVLFDEASKDLEIGCYNKAVSAAYFSVEAFANALFFIKRQKTKGFRGRVNVIKSLLGDDVGEIMENLHMKRNEADHYEKIMAKEDAEEAIKASKRLINMIKGYLQNVEPDIFQE
ncbi:MAG: HEPN domain-containing protein [Candidatus Njordarchaeia archaeon]